MKTITLEFPDTVQIDVREAKTMLVARLYENGTLSLGQAADLAGYTKRTFMELLGNYGISIFDVTGSELDEDIQNAQSHRL